MTASIFASQQPAFRGGGGATNNDILLIVYGQSNVGSQGTQGQTPPAAHSNLSSNTNIRIFNTPNGVSLTGASWQSYQVQTNSNPIQGSAAAGTQFWGREAQFLEYYTAKYPTAKIDIIKYGPGGAQLMDDAGATPTLLPGAVLNGTKHWPFFTATVTAAIAAGLNVSAGHQVVFEFDQGETDAQDATKAAAYAANMTTLYNAVVAAFSPTTIITNQIFGTTTGNSVLLTNNYPYCDTIRAAHASASTALGSLGKLVDDAPAWGSSSSAIHYPPSAIDGVNGTAKRIYELFALPDVSVAGSIAGTAQVGQTLTYTPATWNYTPTSVAYQWNAAGVAIGGATSLTYSPQVSDIGKALTVTETATARLGTTPATCTGTSAVIAAPAEDAATTALVNAAVAAGGSAPGSTRRAAVDALIVGLKADGLWTKLAALEIIAGHDEIFSQMDWKGATKKVAIFAGSPTFVTDRGYTLDGTSQSLTSGLNPTTLSLAQNQVGWGLWIGAGTGTNSACGISGSTGNRFNINKAGSGAISGGCSANATTLHVLAGAPARAVDHYQQRNGTSTTVDYYVDGSISTAAAAQTSTTVQNANLLLGQNGSTVTWASDRYFAHYFTDGTLSAGDVANLHSRLSTYKTTLGA